MPSAEQVGQAFVSAGRVADTKARPTSLPKAYLRLWCLYPLLVPFYLLGKTPVPGKQNLASGVPQVADYYFVGFLGLLLLRLPFRVSRPALSVCAAIVCFVCYTALINFIWATNLEDLSLMTSSLFYTYDCLLFLTVLTLYSCFKDAFLKATFWAVVASVFLQAVLSPLAIVSSFSRQALFFNDENQLGYYCVLSAIIFVAGTRRFSIPLHYQAPFYAAIGYLAFLSQSRSALMGLGTLAVLAVIGRPFRLLVLAAGVVVVYLALTLTSGLVTKSDERLVVQGRYDTLAARGYDRILNYPEYLLFGAGEGAYHRFRSDLYDSEIHSTYGTLLFCYGVVGTCLFAAGLLLIARNDLPFALLIIPAFVHGSAHQGLRFAFFWTMLGFICCLAVDKRKRVA